MVFSVNLTPEEFKKRIHPIDTGLRLVTDSTGVGSSLANLDGLPQGILQSLTTNLSSVGTGGLPKKGQTVVSGSLVKKPAGGVQVILVLSGYVYNNNDVHWDGELAVEDGDRLNLGISNTFATTFAVKLIGYMIRTGIIS
jgi:hypothetical protein